jgi:hypothetical protein
MYRVMSRSPSMMPRVAPTSRFSVMSRSQGINRRFGMEETNQRWEDGQVCLSNVATITTKTSSSKLNTMMTSECKPHAMHAVMSHAWSTMKRDASKCAFKITSLKARVSLKIGAGMAHSPNGKMAQAIPLTTAPTWM